MRAEVVIYVGDLERMRAFYEACLGLTIVERADGYVGLQSETWLVTLVESAAALPTTNPAARRAGTPVKLVFAVVSIETLRSIADRLGGRVAPAGDEWEFRGVTRCDCVDPEGNVLQLIEHPTA